MMFHLVIFCLFMIEPAWPIRILYVNPYLDFRWYFRLQGQLMLKRGEAVTLKADQVPFDLCSERPNAKDDFILK